MSITTYPSDYPAELPAIKTDAATPPKLGWIPDLPDQRDWKYGLQLQPRISAFPNSKMLAWVPGDPQTGNMFYQGNLGSCVANAVTSAILYCRIKQRVNQGICPSRLFNYYNARLLQGWQNWDSGAYIRDGIKAAAKYGSADELQWPYDIGRFAEEPPKLVYDAAYQHKAVAYYRVDQTLEQMKQCLAEDFPFIFGFSLYSDFPWNSTDGVVNLPGKGSYVIGGHAVLCVGFDDGGQRFHFVNSWGKKWGRQGRGSIPYAYLTDPGLADDFWTIRVID